MNKTLLAAASILVLTGALMIAGTAIGTQCYNENETYKKDRMNNFNFMIFNIVSGVFAVLSASMLMYAAFKVDKIESSE